MSRKTYLDLFLPQVRSKRPRLYWISMIHIGFSGPRKIPSLPWPDIGHLAKWSVSSYKFGFGAECLQDDDPDTFWQLSREQHTRALARLTRFSLALMARSRTS